MGIGERALKLGRKGERGNEGECYEGEGGRGGGGGCPVTDEMAID